MPKWGLTVEQRQSKPWELPKHVLEPGKSITDPVHGEIYLTRLESRLVDSPPMQRLRRVRQLGTTHLVYPGASHSRLSHSLGALRAAQDLLDLVIDQRNDPDRVPDIFQEWTADPENYDRKVAEVTILARLGALLHDMCHVPFGHSVEDDLQILKPHDENKERFETLWEQLDEDLRKLLDGGGLASALRPLILSKEKDRPPPINPAQKEYAFVADIVGNTICADLLDYLARDHYFTGLPAKLGRRFLSGFYVTPTQHLYYPTRMVMRIARHGRERNDVTSELFKYLRYRYELSERALVHHAKLAADAMVGKVLEMWKDALWTDLAVKEHPKLAKGSERDIDDLRRRLGDKLSDSQFRDIDTRVEQLLDREFIRRGDDGILEYILDQSEAGAEGDRRKEAIAHIVRSLLNRRLFKLAAQCRSARSMASAIHERYRNPSARRQLELDVTKFTGLSHRQVVLWIPPPKMRMKAAEVLVENGNTISTLYDLDRTLRNRGQEIYESHAALWGISVFVDPEVKEDDEKRRVVLSYLAERLGIQWDLHPYETLMQLAGAKVAKEKNLPHEVAQALLVEEAAYGGDSSTFDALVDRKRTMADLLLQSKDDSKQVAVMTDDHGQPSVGASADSPDAKQAKLQFAGANASAGKAPVVKPTDA